MSAAKAQSEQGEESFWKLLKVGVSPASGFILTTEGGSCKIVRFQGYIPSFHLLTSKGRDVPTHPKQTAEAPVQLPCSQWDSVSQESRVSTQALVSLTVIPLASEGSLLIYTLTSGSTLRPVSDFSHFS